MDSDGRHTLSLQNPSDVKLAHARGNFAEINDRMALTSAETDLPKAHKEWMRTRHTLSGRRRWDCVLTRLGIGSRAWDEAERRLAGWNTFDRRSRDGVERTHERDGRQRVSFGPRRRGAVHRAVHVRKCLRHANTRHVGHPGSESHQAVSMGERGQRQRGRDCHGSRVCEGYTLGEGRHGVESGRVAADRLGGGVRGVLRRRGQEGRERFSGRHGHGDDGTMRTMMKQESWMLS